MFDISLMAPLSTLQNVEKRCLFVQDDEYPFYPKKCTIKNHVTYITLMKRFLFTSIFLKIKKLIINFM